MRMFRRLAAGLALAALAPSLVQAQEGRSFTDSWFWGAKAANMVFWTKKVAHESAQGLGLETMITRKYAALYLSAEWFGFGDFFDLSDGAPSSIAGEPVTMNNMRRATVALMTFPKNFGGIRPYAGAGFSFNYVSIAIPEGSLVTSGQLADAKATIAPNLMLGVQAQYRRFSVFGQGHWMWAQRDYFVLNDNTTYVIEAGIRYNFGTSIDPDV